MSDDPNERAARLAGRWGDEDDAADRDEGAAENEGVAGNEAKGENGGGDEDAARSGDGARSEDAVETTTEVDEGAERKDQDDERGDGEAADSEDGDGRALTTREMQSQMLYLPPEFHKEVDLTFEELNLRFRRERDRKLEKNRDFYLGLLQLGLAELGDVGDRELDEVEELLDL